MPSMQFNQFQKELQNRGIDGQVAYMLTYMYEQMIQQMQQIDEMAKLMVTFAEGVQKVVIMQQTDQKHLASVISKVNGFNKPDGIEVHSVANDPSEKG